MFDFKNDKQKEDKQKLLTGVKTFILIGIVLIILGSILIAPAFAVNMTALNEIKDDLSPQLEYENTFSVFWIIFLLLILAIFMLTAFVRKTEREMVFFSIGAVIVSFMITLMFISPISFDYIVTDQQIIIEEIQWNDGSITYNSGITKNSKLIQVIPADGDFRMSLSLIFTGVSLFNGLYAILILTQFSTKAVGGNNLD